MLLGQSNHGRDGSVGALEGGAEVRNRRGTNDALDPDAHRLQLRRHRVAAGALAFLEAPVCLDAVLAVEHQAGGDLRSPGALQQSDG